MATIFFDSKDPSLLSSVLKTQSPLPTDLAVRCELWNWAKDYRTANPTATVDDLVKAFVEHQNAVKYEMAGRKEFPYDIPDDLHQLLGLAEGAVNFITDEKAKSIAEGVVGLGKGIMELTPVEEWAKNYHAENAAEATGEIVGRNYSTCDDTVAAVAPMLRDDLVFNQALATVDRDAAAGSAMIPTAPGDVLKAHDDVFNQTIIKQYFTVQVDSGLSAQIDNVQEVLNDQLSGISTQMQQQYASLHGDITQLQAGQKALLAYVQDQQARQADAAAQAAKQAQYEAAFVGAQTAVNVLASVAGLVDPKLGRQIGQVGSACVQIGRAAVDLVNAVTNCMSATLTAASALGAAVATGNFIGAALNLVNVFTGLGAESPDQMILEQIGQLRQQIDAFHQDMTARFDQVDKELNTIYTNVMAALNKIDIQLGHIQDTVDNILSDVVVEQVKLDRIIRSLNAYFANQYRLPLQTAINTDLGWPVGQPMGMDEFMRARGVFYTFAYQGAYADPQEAPVDGRPTDNASLANELSGPADQNIAFANHVLAVRGWPTFASDTPDGRPLPGRLPQLRMHNLKPSNRRSPRPL